MENERTRKLESAVKVITADPLIRKHMASTKCWKESGAVEVRLKTEKNVFNRCIIRIVDRNKGILLRGGFCASENDRPAMIRFYIKY